MNDNLLKQLERVALDLHLAVRALRKSMADPRTLLTDAAVAARVKALGSQKAAALELGLTRSRVCRMCQRHKAKRAA